jgi:hypothetical protein
MQVVDLASGCSIGRVVVDGATRERVRWLPRDGGRCPDCSTVANGYHHIGCRQESCPNCGRAFAVCGCALLKSHPRPRGGGEPRELEFAKE